MTKPKPTSWSVAVACKGRGGESGTPRAPAAGYYGARTPGERGWGTARMRHCGITHGGQRALPQEAPSASSHTQLTDPPGRPREAVGPRLPAAAAAREPREGSGRRFSPSSPCYRAEQ